MSVAFVAVLARSAAVALVAATLASCAAAATASDLAPLSQGQPCDRPVLVVRNSTGMELEIVQRVPGSTHTTIIAQVAGGYHEISIDDASASFIAREAGGMATISSTRATRSDDARVRLEHFCRIG